MHLFILRLGHHLTGLAVQVIFDGRMQGVGPQVGAVQLVGRQAPQGLGHVGVLDLHGLFQGLALGQLGDHAGDGNGRAAAEGLKLDIFNTVVFHLDIDAHHIPADGIAHFSQAVRIDDFSDITGTFEMIQNYWGISHDSLQGLISTQFS